MHKIFLGESFSKKLLLVKSKLDNVSLEILCEQKFLLRLSGKNILNRKQNNNTQKGSYGIYHNKSH